MAQRFPFFSTPQLTVLFSENLFSQKEKNEFFLKSSYKHLDFPEENLYFLHRLRGTRRKSKRPAQLIERLTTDQKVWGSNPYGRVTCITASK